MAGALKTTMHPRFLSSSSTSEEDFRDIPIGWASSEEKISIYFVIFLPLLALVLILSKFLHDKPSLGAVLPEAGMTIIVGMIAGALIFLVKPEISNVHYDAFYDYADDGIDDATDKDDDGASEVQEVATGLLSFSATFFFAALLPPIIFNSGYHVNQVLFFRHIKPIILYSCLGTVFSILGSALIIVLAVNMNVTGDFKPKLSEILVFGSLISSTDPVSTLAVFQKKRVDPQLFYLVFGESVLNDAVCLVLFNALTKFVGREMPGNQVLFAILHFLMDFTISFCGSLTLGVLCGLGSAFLLKHIDMRSTRLLELSLYVMIMYLPFFLAEVMHMSGIVSILFTGIAARHWAAPNLSEDTAADADSFFRLISHLAETVIFLEMGLSVFGLSLNGGHFGLFILWSLLACLVSRASNVYPMTFLYNFSIDREIAARQREADSHKSNLYHDGGYGTDIDDPNDVAELMELKIPAKTAHMMWFSGLRGAVAYACAKMFPDAYGNQAGIVYVTMVMVLTTIFGLGSATEMVLYRLNIDVGVDEDQYMTDKSNKVQRGMLKTLDEKYLSPCVIREFHSSKQPTSPREQMLMPLPLESSATKEFTRNQVIEVTMSQHEMNLYDMGYCFNKRNRVKDSVYDYGAN